MASLLLWLYLTNFTLLILHEMDSAYWKEWEMFHLPGGAGVFLLIHFPLFLLGGYGVALLVSGALGGLILSLVLGLAGMAAFGIHSFFLWRGRPEFRALVSRLILWALLVVSLFQLCIATMVLIGSS